MIRRDLHVYDAVGAAIGYVGIDETKADESVEIGVLYDGEHVPSSRTATFDLEGFNDLVVILNEAAKYFGFELVMSPISIRKKDGEEKRTSNERGGPR